MKTNYQNIKKTCHKLVISIGMIGLSHFGFSQSAVSGIRIQRVDSTYQLLLNDQPFYILGGETGNSVASTEWAMQAVWPKIKSMGLNTVLAPVYWELIEPQEGKFDFSSVEHLLRNARNHNIKLVLLWFGTWKNSMSSYVPQWVKTNSKRFIRTQDNNQRSQEILSALDKNSLSADKKAYSALLQFIKEKDANHQTVLMMQVENEIGMLPTAREFSKLADVFYQSDVPASLINYLQKNKNQLKPYLFEKWKNNGFKTKGHWESVFGKGIETEEIFQAWQYASFANEIAAAGKKIYDLPTFVNAALPSETRKIPGDYPSAGPLPHLMDIWKAAAPAIDLLAPDFYNPKTQYWCDGYFRADNPLFIPEIRFDETVGAKALFVMGRYKALGFSPFHIESAEGQKELNLTKSYSLLKQIAPFLNSTWKNYDGFLLSKEEQEIKKQFGKYVFTIKHDYTLGWNALSKETDWSLGGALIAQIGEDEFVMAGTGVVVTVECIDKNQVSNILSVQHISYENKIEKIISHYNGDQTHQGRHIRTAVGDWEIQKFKLYHSPAKID